jgi:iron complex transport system substrate-binding protein
VRIASLLPALTELVGFLGHETDLVGVTHECDDPPAVDRLPRLTRSLLDPQATAAEIDAAVRAQGGGLYHLDAHALAASAPDLVLTQAQCDVCAVGEARVRDVAAALPGHPRVLAVNPTNLAGVRAMILEVAALLGPDATARAATWVADFDHLAATLAASRPPGTPPVRVAHLEWLDPPFTSGHWNPELIALAGGLDVLAAPGAASRRTTWDAVAAAQPEVLLVAPCGFDLARTLDDWLDIVDSSHLDHLRPPPRVVLADANRHFSRPGPRLLDSLAIAAAAVDPDLAHLAPADGWSPWPPHVMLGG